MYLKLFISIYYRYKTCSLDVTTPPTPAQEQVQFAIFISESIEQYKVYMIVQYSN